MTLDEKSDQATFTVPVELPARDYFIHIKYTGILNDKLRGFYLSETPPVLRRNLNDGRAAGVSCFDEPAYNGCLQH